MFVGKKVLWLDTETTGVNPYEHAIIQISGIIEISGEVKENFNFNVRPHDGAKIAQTALDVNKKTVEQIYAYPHVSEIKNKIEFIFARYCDKYKKNKTVDDKFQLAGYNVGFDLQFLDTLWKKCDDNFLGSFVNYNHKLDVMAVIDFLRATGRIVLDSSKLISVCKHFGIALDAHDSFNDILATRQLAKMIDEKITFDNSIIIQPKIDDEQQELF